MSQTIRHRESIRAYSADRLHVASSVPALRAAKELYTRGPELERAPLPPMDVTERRRRISFTTILLACVAFWTLVAFLLH